LIHPAVWPQQTCAKNWEWAGGDCAPSGEVELGPHLSECGLGWGLPPYQVAS